MDKMKFTPAHSIKIKDKDTIYASDYIEFEIMMKEFGVYLKTNYKAESSYEPVEAEISFHPWHMVEKIIIQ